MPYITLSYIITEIMKNNIEITENAQEHIANIFKER